MTEAPKSEIPKAIKSGGKHTFLPLAALEIDPAVQRALDRAWVREHAAAFDPELFGEIVVSLRQGRYFVVDGQHRTELLRSFGWHDQKVPVLLYEGLTLAEEAELFLGLADRKAIRTFDKFRIRITSGDRVACDVQRIVRACGLVLDQQHKDGAIGAVVSLERVYRGCGLAKKETPELLTRTLRLLKGAWGVSPDAFEGSLIHGAGLVLFRYADKVDDASFAQKLSKARGGPAGLIGIARGYMDSKRRPGGQCMAAAMVDTYNVGRRTGKLEDWWATA